MLISTACKDPCRNYDLAVCALVVLFQEIEKVHFIIAVFPAAVHNDVAAVLKRENISHSGIFTGDTVFLTDTGQTDLRQGGFCYLGNGFRRCVRERGKRFRNHSQCGIKRMEAHIYRGGVLFVGCEFVCSDGVFIVLDISRTGECIQIGGVIRFRRFLINILEAVQALIAGQHAELRRNGNAGNYTVHGAGQVILLQNGDVLSVCADICL